MAWVFQSSLLPQHQRGIELTPETRPVCKADKQAFFVDVLKELMNHPPGYAQGFKYPKPSMVYEFDCYYKTNEFYNFMFSEIGLLIPRRVINIIEDIEPGVHQYFPVRLKLRSGEPKPEPYFILNVCTLIEALDREASNVHVTHLPKERHEFRPWNKVTITPKNGARCLNEPYDLFVSKDKINGRAVWCEYGMAVNPFFSEEFVERINEIGGIEAFEPHYRVGEI